MANIKTVRPYGYFDRALQKYFPTERSKREHMKRHGIKHDGSMESETHRDRRNAEIINQDRNKQGRRSKTLQELAGDARKVKGRTLYFHSK